jgi:exodeoxyribonuclease V alpha subunit
VGDADQLPPIGPGNFFQDLVLSPKVRSLRLAYSYRQEKGSSIAANAARINNGLGPHTYTFDDAFRFLNTEKEKMEDTAVLEYVSAVREFGAENVCCLSPMKTRSTTGTEVLNKRIRDILNPRRAGQGFIELKYSEYREGDRVIQLENTEEASNGDVGTITRIQGDMARILFDDGREAVYERRELVGRIGLAYALTVHTAQGSEYKKVIITMNSEHSFMLQRQLLYTAVTRARESVVIVGDAKSLALCAKKLPSAMRNTKLRERIGGSRFGN